MNNKTWAAAFLFAAVAMSACAVEGEAGMIKNSSGDVSIVRSGTRIPGAVGTPVSAADKVRTGADGSVGMTLRDSTLLSAGPNSLIVLDKFVFDSTTNAGTLSVSVKKGTLAVATGKIAKETPESIDFRTSTAVIGVRGTEFVIDAGAGNDD